MGQVLVRRLDRAEIDALKAKAKANGRPLEQELREILTAAARLSVDEKLALVERASAMTRAGAAPDGRGSHTRGSRPPMTVVDASVALKWFVPERGSTEARRLLADDIALEAPDLVIAELSNAAWRLARMGAPGETACDLIAGEARNLFHGIHALGPPVPRAMVIARTVDHPVYDCFYVALAEQRARHDHRRCKVDRPVSRDRVGLAAGRSLHPAGNTVTGQAGRRRFRPAWQ